MKEYDGQLRLVIKVYPYKYRDFAHMAAEAALSAWEQGRFRQMHEIMLLNSPRLDSKSLMRYAREAGLNMPKFKADLEGMRHRPHIDRVFKLGIELDLYNTPTFFINGRKIVGNVPYEYLKKAIEEALNEAGE